MKTLIEIFKDSGLNELIEEIQKRYEGDQLKIKDLAKKIEMLELQIDFNSAIYVQSGASIEPVEKIKTFYWKADDVSEFFTGIDAITYNGEKPTRWASDKSKMIKIALPICREEERKLLISFDKGINHNVLSSLKIFIDGKKSHTNIVKNSNEYLYSHSLKKGYQGINTIVNIEFNDFLEGKDRHTIGLCSLEVA